MSFIYHENGITTSQVDYFCLVCESFLKSKVEADSHILKPVHKKNLQAANYCEQFKNDHIRKVKGGYFCEFCNSLFPTTVKVNLHLQDDKHTTNRGNQLLVKIGNFVTAFGNIKISESAWNGFIGEICALCNIEFVNEDLHKTTTSHLLNLIYKKVEFTRDNDIYRKIDEDSFHCLTCNKELALNTSAQHFDDNSHKIMYQQCLENYKDTKNNEKTESKTVEANENKIVENNLNKIVGNNENTIVHPNENKKVQANEIKIVEANENKIDQASENKNVQANENKIVQTNENKVENNEKVKNVDAKKNGAIPKAPVTSNKKSKDKKTNVTAVDIDERICKELGAQDYIMRDIQGELHCMVCSINLQGSPNEHLATMHHQALVKMHKEYIQNNYERNPDNTQNNNQSTVTPKKTENSQKKNISKILDSVSVFQKQDININFETYIASCKKCNQVVEFDCEAIKNHIESHKNKPKVEKETKTFDSPTGVPKKGTLFSSPVQKKFNIETKSRSSSVSSCDGEIEELAKQHNLSHNRNRNSMFCELCKVSVPMAKKNILEHVNGQYHKYKQPKLSAKKQKPQENVVSLRKINAGSFINHISTVESLFCHDVILNKEFCITFESFVMLQKHNVSNNIKCFACDVRLNEFTTASHVQSFNHKYALEHALNILVDGEFVREIRNKFHCGYCNIIENSWTDMNDHFQTGSHTDAKHSAKSRLETHLQELENQNNHQEVDLMDLIRLHLFRQLQQNRRGM